MEAADIFDYLPITFKTKDEETYIRFLWNSYESNYKNQQYQFAFIAFHLLFMTYAYFQIWKIYNMHKEEFRKSLLGFEKLDNIIGELEERNKKNIAEKKQLEVLYPFAFSEIQERTIMTFFKLIGCDKMKIGRYKKIVDERNEIAHATGKLIFVAAENLDRKIDEILLLVDEIQNHSVRIIDSTISNFLHDSCDSENREFIDDIDQIQNVLVNQNYLSRKDIRYMLKFEIDRFSTEAVFKEKKSLFQIFCKNYSEE